jgi:hypothetical protein
LILTGTKSAVKELSPRNPITASPDLPQPGATNR